MPRIVNNTIVCSLEELVPDHWPSYDALRKALSRAEKRGWGVRRYARGGNGGELLIDFDSLDVAIRNALGDPRTATHILEHYFACDQKAVTYFQDNGYIDDAHTSRNVANASVLNACIALLADRQRERLSKGGRVTGMMSLLCNDAQSFNDVLRTKWDMEHNLPGSPRPFERKMKLYQQESYASLIHAGTGNTNRRKVTGDVHELMRNMYSGRAIKPTYMRVSREWESFLRGDTDIINPATGEQYDPSNYPPLGRSTIYNYLSEWDSKIGTDYRRGGDHERLVSKYVPYAEMQMPEYSGMVISVDDRQPPFKCTTNKRSWMYCGEDVASQAITVWVFDETKEGMIVNFYRQMARNYAEWGLCLPYELECESSLNSTFKDGLLKPGNMFGNVRVERNNPRGKYIEMSFNKGVRYADGYEKDEKGWIARPFAKDESNQNGRGKVPELAYEAIIEMEQRMIWQWNNSEHPRHKGKSRWDVFLSTQHESLEPINWRGILPYIGMHTDTSCRAGAMKVDGQGWYIGEGGTLCTGADLIERMRQIEGQDVTVYWLRGNDGQMLKMLVYRGDRYICEAVAKPRPARATLGKTEDDDTARELFERYRGTVTGYQQKQSQAIEPVLVVQKTPRVVSHSFEMHGYRPMAIPDYMPPEVIDDMDEVVDDEDTDSMMYIPANPNIKDRF